MQVTTDGADAYTTGDLVRLFGVHPTTIGRWARRDLPPSFRTAGGHSRWLKAELDPLLAYARQERSHAPVPGT